MIANDHAINQFVGYLNAAQRERFEGPQTPAHIQAFLDTLPYATEDFNRCPLRALQDGRANCFDGALLGAAALRRLGDPPLLVDLYPEPGTDDEHVLAIFKRAGHFGAVAKSNFVGLRFREPVYRTLRELVMSYFEAYYNVQGQRTLRSYTRPLSLAGFDRLSWMWSDAVLPAIAGRLDSLARIAVLTPEMAAGLSPLDELSRRAGLLVADEKGLFRPIQ